MYDDRGRVTRRVTQVGAGVHTYIHGREVLGESPQRTYNCLYSTTLNVKEYKCHIQASFVDAEHIDTKHLMLMWINYWLIHTRTGDRWLSIRGTIKVTHICTHLIGNIEIHFKI